MSQIVYELWSAGVFRSLYEIPRTSLPRLPRTAPTGTVGFAFMELCMRADDDSRMGAADWDDIAGALGMMPPQVAGWDGERLLYTVVAQSPARLSRCWSRLGWWPRPEGGAA